MLLDKAVFCSHLGGDMDLRSPMSSVVPSAHGPVLSVLARTHAPLTGRRVAKLTNPPTSQRQVSTVLTALTEAGIVQRETQGSAHLYTLNRDHIAADAIASLSSLREELWTRMRAEIQSWTPKPAAVAVFGSAARGDGTTASDIDVLVVRDESVEADDPQWQGNLASFADHVSRWSGNSCEILERSPSALEVLATNGERLIGELRRDAIFLHGDHRVLPSRTGTVA
jgi:predicted nucleotidyltransferase